MTTIVSSVGLKGIEGYRVQVEVQTIPGLEGVSIVGLPDTSVKESKDRVMATLFANGCEFPNRKFIVNLSPSEQKKNSPIFDLAIAIGVMSEGGYIREPIPCDTAFLGVLSLDGTIKPVQGMLPAILAAKKEKFKVIYLPFMQDFPIVNMEGIELRFIYTLREVVDSISGKVIQIPPNISAYEHTSNSKTSTYDKDFKNILGQKRAKRAFEIAAAGGHNVFMSGPPGCGKSLLAETFPSILPMLSQDQQFEVMSIYQLSGLLHSNFQLPPFRTPHHTASSVSLIGGGSNPKPGEVSLAHHGVLFLDEMAEFPKRTLDMLRQPLETGKVTISRVASSVTYPSRFMLIGAMNPCPCGFLGAKHTYCTCTPKQIKAYQNRLSGPILDRIDILLSLSVVSLENESNEKNEYSATILNRVIDARNKQFERYGGGILNANVAPEVLLEECGLSIGQQKFLRQQSSKMNWSTRIQMKIIRIARTISDLNGDKNMTDEALWEAMTLRRETPNKDNLSLVR